MELGSTIGSAWEKLKASDLTSPLPIKSNSMATVGRLVFEKPTARIQTELDRQGVRLDSYVGYSDLDEFIADKEWTLGQVWAPFKKAVVEYCDVLLPAAKETGAVDTLVRSEGSIVGVNTNAAAAASSIKWLLGETKPERILIMGSGPSARSTVVGLKNEGFADFGVIGRTRENVAKFVEEFGGHVVTNAGEFEPDLILNITTVGETEDGELDFDISGVFRPGVYFWDINQTASNLQRDALEIGCNVQSGVVMQHICYALRAKLLNQSAA